MKMKRFARKSGQMLCGVSFALVLAAAGQDGGDDFGDDEGGMDDGGGGESSDPFADGNANKVPFFGSYNQRIFRKGKASEVLKSQKDQVAVMIEMIEVDHFVANELMLKYSKKANDVGMMRESLIAMVKKGEAQLQETLWGRSPLNELSKIEAIVEKIYPTEYEPPELPQFVVGGVSEKKDELSAQAALNLSGDLYTGATPTSFDTKNTGVCFEFEAAKSAEQPGQLGLSVFLTVVKFLQYDTFLADGHEKDARGTANIVMPRFSVITQEFVATVTPGKHSLLGVFKNGGDADESKRVVILMHVEMIAKE